MSALELLRGTLNLLTLDALVSAPLHGSGAIRSTNPAPGRVVEVEEGTLHPAPHGLEDRGWVESDSGLSENNRKARYCQLTAKGRSQLKAEVREFTQFTRAVFNALELPRSAAS